MHMKSDQLIDLAGAYVRKNRLNDDQLAIKSHMAECDRCYGEFCRRYMEAKILYDNGWVSLELEEDAGSQKALLSIRLWDGIREVVKGKLAHLEEAWTFVQIPRLAFARDSERAGKEEEVRYQSVCSQDSLILQEDNEIVLQLDANLFPVDQLAVRVTDETQEQVKHFTYDRTSGCYVVRIPRTDTAMREMIIQIIQE